MPATVATVGIRATRVPEPGTLAVAATALTTDSPRLKPLGRPRVREGASR